MRTIRSIRAGSRLNIDDILVRASVPPPGKGTTKAADSLNQHYKQHPAFPAPSGNDAAKNALAHEVLVDIVESSGRQAQTVVRGNFPGGVRFVAPDGRFAVFDDSGEFRYFGA